jgi:hypothetical protein
VMVPFELRSLIRHHVVVTYTVNLQSACWRHVTCINLVRPKLICVAITL